MKLPIFLIGAIVLIVFAIIATASATLTFIGTITWFTWLCASLLSFLVHCLWPADLGAIQLPVRRREQAPPPAPAPPPQQ